jgi:hypothetical protein
VVVVAARLVEIETGLELPQTAVAASHPSNLDIRRYDV